jgi:hypothetical protein
MNAILAVDLNAVPIVCRDRSIPRKEQSALARGLFRSLGIKGLRVRVNRGAWLTSVHIQGILNDEAKETQKKLYAILDKAFPNHDDRSDTRIDHFDYKWSINLHEPEPPTQGES